MDGLDWGFEHNWGLVGGGGSKLAARDDWLGIYLGLGSRAFGFYEDVLGHVQTERFSSWGFLMVQHMHRVWWNQKANTRQ